ncbi:MAG: hypothetical protein ABI614_21275, partial [Planctomycetota bacterium]
KARRATHIRGRIPEDGASYILAGSTENTFAGLVVLLGYTNLFLRTDQAHDVAWFESNDHAICGVWRVRPVKCPKCKTQVDRAVMARRLKQGKSQAFCEDCGELVILPPDEPIHVKPDQHAVIAHEGAVAELRTTFEEVIYELQRLAAAEKFAAPTCFVSYAWGNPDHERWSNTAWRWISKRRASP